MSTLSKLNNVPVYAVCGGIITFAAVVCVVFMARAYPEPVCV